MENVIAYPAPKRVAACPLTRDLASLRKTALEVRRHIVRMTAAAKSGHPGGSLSAADILVALYFGEMRHFPIDPSRPDRDRFVLSKGHGCPALYAVLAMTGYFPEEELLRLRQMGSMLQGHPCMLKTPGVEMSTGSLGQGLSIANGMALAQRLSGYDYRVYCLLGDGEVQEGQIWEAALTSAHWKLDNLVCFIDYNGIQLDGKVSKIKGIAPLVDKWTAFGWHAMEVNGHNFQDLQRALDEARRTKGRPTMIVANTIKGKGVSFMEYNVSFHGNAPNEEQVRIALEELELAGEKLREEHLELSP